MAFVSVQYSVSEERSHAMEKSLVEGVPADIVIFDSIQSRHFREFSRVKACICNIQANRKRSTPLHERVTCKRTYITTRYPIFLHQLNAGENICQGCTATCLFRHRPFTF